MRWVAYMPLRGGSKSIPHKNIRLLAGKPLFAWSLEQAVASGCFDEIHVGTDSGTIRSVVETLFANTVGLSERSPETCTDESSTESALLEFSEQVDFDVLCLIQATSPLTRATDFKAAKKLFLAENADSLLTATNTKRFFWSLEGQPLNYEPAKRPRRQEFGGSLMENGAFYFTRHDLLEQAQCRLGGKISIYEMAGDNAVEIDEPGDWDRVASILLREGMQKNICSVSGIRGLVVDVDGTLTDGGMYYGPQGEALKKFNTRDAHGLQRVERAGLRFCVMTQEQSEVVKARMHKLRVNDYYPGVTDKLAKLYEIAQQWHLPLKAIAFIGDDLNDLTCMNAVGLACCPRDAVPEIRAVADYVAEHDGGAGAVRDVCDLLLCSQPAEPVAD